MKCEQRSTQHSFRFLLPLGMVVCGVIFMLSGFDFLWIQHRLEQAGPLAPFAFILISIFLMSVVLPKTVISLAAGALFGTLVGSVMMLVIALAAALLNYSIGRWWLHDLIQSRLESASVAVPLSRTKLLRTMRDLASDAGFGFHLLIRLAPLPTMMISYLMGAGGAKMRPYLFAAAVAVIPQSLWVHGGSAASLIHDPNASPLAWISIGTSVFAAIVLSILVPRVALRKMRCYEHDAKLSPGVPS